jgi:16S rRNA (cytidine1402-2'-O)-methyltransferase
LSATLYLVPSTLGEAAAIATLPLATIEIIRALDHWVVETPKIARRFLKAAGVGLGDKTLAFAVLDEHTAESRIDELLEPLRSGASVGVLSDAGCPGIADPGARLARRAHALGFPVVALVGPSAIVLALMASGLNGQRFVFHGYLPRESVARARRLSALEKDSARLDQTQIFIETPYRNEQLLEAILNTCTGSTDLSIAVDLTLPTQFFATLRIEQWKSQRPQLGKRPAVFLLHARHQRKAAPP